MGQGPQPDRTRGPMDGRLRTPSDPAPARHHRVLRLTLAVPATAAAHHVRQLALSAVCLIGGACTLSAQENRTAPQNHVIEVAFESTVERTDPFNEVELDAIFAAPDGTERRVPAFWRGGRVWAVRYSSSAVGEHGFRTECSDTADTGLHGVTGAATVTPYDGDNPLYQHGAIVVAPDCRHFMHEDGTPFLWLGDTWWMGLCKRIRWPEDFHTLAADRVAKGFSVIQIVAGLYPDMPAFDERGANEAG